jgi:hypothetical protein
MLGLMSGWFNLQQWYSDDGGEEPLLKLGGQSGSMGFGVALNGCLILRAYPSGLGVAIWRAFAPFQKPLRIPWSEIDAEPSSSFLIPMVKLHLGKPKTACSDQRSELVTAGGCGAAKRPEPVSDAGCPAGQCRIGGASHVRTVGDYHGHFGDILLLRHAKIDRTRAAFRSPYGSDFRR